jgi:hypothetical protein
MIVKAVISEIKWITFALIITFILVTIFNSNVVLVRGNANAYTSFFGLSKAIEIAAFFIFNTFVVFGIKGFFEMYSHKITNVIMIVTGTLLTLAIMFLSYQILFRD